MRNVLLITALLLGGCSVFTTTPQPPPPATNQPQEINRAQSAGLSKIGSTTVTVRGSPDDAERALAARAQAAGATWYQIQFVKETVAPGMWYASALLYGPVAGGQ